MVGAIGEDLVFDADEVFATDVVTVALVAVVVDKGLGVAEPKLRALAAGEGEGGKGGGEGVAIEQEGGGGVGGDVDGGAGEVAGGDAGGADDVAGGGGGELHLREGVGDEEPGVGLGVDAAGDGGAEGDGRLPGGCGRRASLPRGLCGFGCGPVPAEGAAVETFAGGGDVVCVAHAGGFAEEAEAGVLAGEPGGVGGGGFFGGGVGVEDEAEVRGDLADGGEVAEVPDGGGEGVVPGVEGGSEIVGLVAPVLDVADGGALADALTVDEEQELVIGGDVDEEMGGGGGEVEIFAEAEDGGVVAGGVGGGDPMGGEAMRGRLRDGLLRDLSAAEGGKAEGGACDDEPAEWSEAHACDFMCGGDKLSNGNKEGVAR